MKLYMIASVLMLALASCNDGSKAGNTTDNEKSNATANDSTQHPNGMTEPSAISVDTAATRVNSAKQK